MTAVTWSAPPRPAAARARPALLPAYVPTGIPLDPGPRQYWGPPDAAGGALQQGQNDNAVTVAPLSAVQPGSALGDEVPINDAYLTTPVVKLTAGAAYNLLGAVMVPAGGRLYVNGATVDRTMIVLGPGAVIVDDGVPGPQGPPGPAGPAGPQGPAGGLVLLGYATSTVTPSTSAPTVAGTLTLATAGPLLAAAWTGNVPTGVVAANGRMTLSLAAQGAHLQTWSYVPGLATGYSGLKVIRNVAPGDYPFSVAIYSSVTQPVTVTPGIAVFGLG